MTVSVPTSPIKNSPTERIAQSYIIFRGRLPTLYGMLKFFLGMLVHVFDAFLSNPPKCTCRCGFRVTCQVKTFEIFLHKPCNGSINLISVSCICRVIINLRASTINNNLESLPPNHGISQIFFITAAPSKDASIISLIRCFGLFQHSTTHIV